MDVEKALLSKVIHTGAFTRLVSEGFDETHFIDQDLRDIFTYMVNYLQKYRSHATIGVIQKEFPNTLLPVVPEATDYLIDEMKVQIKRRVVTETLREVASAFSDQNLIKDIDTLLLERSRAAIQSVPGGVVGRYSNMLDRIDQYQVTKQMGGKSGIQMGVLPFDNETGGIQTHELVSIVGWQGVGKSSLSQFMCFNAYLQGYTPMIFSLEMESEALFRRFDTMATHFEYKKLKEYNLPDEEVAQWEELAKKAKKAKNDIIILSKIGKCTVDKVYSEILKYSPDLVCIDYLSLMETPRKAGSMWESVTYLTQNLKQLARTIPMPILSVAQTNIGGSTEGAQLDNIAFSRSIGADSDIVIGLGQRDEHMRKNHQMKLRLLKNRDGRILETDLYWELETMTIREWNIADAFRINTQANAAPVATITDETSA